ncbi:MAG: ABC transporter ATP-binding protein [Erysipelotrichaceae bacterium]|nr:ABC transporter ATP-binding protein [Erysipelotrichaceae bacterium]
MSLITCRNLILGYEDGPIGSELNFTVNKGDYLCIIGENGSGKTTLMKTLLGLLKPYGGEVLFGDGLKQEKIGYLPQQTLVQKDFPASVREVVLSGRISHLGNHFFYQKKDREEAERQMARLQIKNLENHSYRSLSGGQQQRVLLARALCATDDLLVLDEPVTGLDANITKIMYETIRQLHKEGMTIIMISHDIHAALKYATHILSFEDTHFFGTKDQYLQYRQKKGGSF